MSKSSAAFAVLMVLFLCRCSAPTATGESSTEKSADITVGKNVQVSLARPNDHHNEVIIAADPSNVDRLIACSIINTNHMGRLPFTVTISYTSDDGGSTWNAATTNPLGKWNPDLGSWDPDCTYGDSGRAFFIAGTDSVKRIGQRYSGPILATRGMRFRSPVSSIGLG